MHHQYLNTSMAPINQLERIIIGEGKRKMRYLMAPREQRTPSPNRKIIARAGLAKINKTSEATSAAQKAGENELKGRQNYQTHPPIVDPSYR